MKFVKIKFILIVFLLFLVASSCRHTSQDPLPSPDIEPYIIYPDTTIPISDNTIGEITVDLGNNIIEIPAGSYLIDKVNENDIIVIGSSSETPNGLLVRAKTVSTENGTLVVTTEEATLEDAFESGYIDIHQTLDPTNINNSVANAPGVSFSSRSRSERFVFEDGLSLPFHYDLTNVILFDINDDYSESGMEDPIDKNGRVIVNGAIDLGLDLTFKTEIDFFEIQYLQFEVEISESLDLSVESYISQTLSESKTIYTHNFLPITVYISGVPVSITPIVSINVGIDGSVEASITASVSQYGSITNGLNYSFANGEWTPYQNVDFGFDYTPPTGNLKCNIHPYAGPTLDLLLYNAAGPFLGVNGFLDFTIDTDIDPWWTLDAGVEAFIGINIEKITKNLERVGIYGIEPRYTHTFNPYVRRIAEGDESFQFNLDDGLVSYYKLNNDVIDSHGANDGSASGGLYSTGKLEQGYTINTDNSDYISIPIVPQTEHSFSFWIYVNNFGSANNSTIFGDSDNAQEYYNFVFRYRSGGDQTSRGFYLTRNGNDGKQPTQIKTNDTDYPVNANEWIHFTITSDNSGYTKIYLNGSVYLEGDLGEIHSGISGMYFGDGDPLESTLGVYDEIGYWTRELSSTEVSDIYNGGVGLSYEELY